MKTILIGVTFLLSSVAFARDVIQIEEVTDIVGKVRKPEVTLFIARQNLSTDYKLELRRSFVNDVIKSVDKRPFR